jgi:hypothetical protein
MDGKRFDALLKTLTAGSSRRRMMQGLIGGALGTGVIAARSPRTAAVARWRGCRYLCPTSGQEVVRCALCPTRPNQPECPPIHVKGEECTVCADRPCNTATREECVAGAPTTCL